MDQQHQVLLQGHSEFHDDDSVVCRGYFLTDRHWRQPWDGKSKLPAELSTIVQNALRAAGEGMVVKGVQLASTTVSGVGEVFFYTVEVGAATSTRFSRFKAGGQKIVLDLAGLVVEPEERRFTDSKEHEAFEKSLYPGR